MGQTTRSTLSKQLRQWLRRVLPVLFQVLQLTVWMVRTHGMPTEVSLRVQWLLAFFYVFHVYFRIWHTRQLTDALRLCKQFSVPFHYPFEWHCQNQVLYLRVHPFRRLWYIGSTDADISKREQTRLSKFVQVRRERQAYFEPALQYWHLTDSYHDFFPVVLHACSQVSLLRSIEASTIVQFRAQLNAPYVHRRLKKLGVPLPTFRSDHCCTGKPGQRAHRRRLRMLARMRLSECQMDFQETAQHLDLLNRLGSNTSEKFNVSRLLRSAAVSTSFVFYLLRLLPHLDALPRSRAHDQLRQILRFRGTDLPPRSFPLRVNETPTGFIRTAKDWLKQFVENHQEWFPPYHLPKAQIAEVANPTLGSSLFNHRSFIAEWSPSTIPTCTCAQFPTLPRTPWNHILCSASQAVTLLPDHFPAILLSNMKDPVALDNNRFVRLQMTAFKRWSRAWKLPPSSTTAWWVFLQDHLQQQTGTGPSGQTVQQLRAAHRILKTWVTFPADHHPTELHLACPVQFHYLLLKTFFDGQIFRPLPQAAACTLSQVLAATRAQLGSYHTLVLRRKRLPQAYLLPKESKKWCGARPIVAYSHTWNAKLSSVVAVATMLLTCRVFGRAQSLPSCQYVLRQIWQVMQRSTLGEEMELRQQDLVGFYSAVPHSRILDSIEYLVYRYCEAENVALDQELSVSIRQADRINRVFRGHFRRHAHRHYQVVLKDLPMLVHYLLKTAVLCVGSSVVQQVQGASMGSQLAPALCSVFCSCS